MLSHHAVLSGLAEVVGHAHVLTTEQEITPFVQDWRGRFRGKALAVVQPATVEQVAQIVMLCAEQRIAIVPQGGNTGLVGGATPQGDEVVVSLSRLNRILEIDTDNASLTAQAGVTLKAVQDAAQLAGFLFPLSLASEGSCQIGGNLSTNAGGTAVLRYGTMRELVLGLEVVLPDGKILHSLRSLRKDNTGYDLKQLFIGAEGTLGIITAAVLKLFPTQQNRSTVLVGLASPAAALAFLRLARQQLGDRLVSFEMFSALCLELVLTHIPHMHNVLPGHAWYVLLEATDSSLDADLSRQIEFVLNAAITQSIVIDAVIAQSNSQAEQLWALRENISEAQKKAGFGIKHDIALPLNRIVEFINRVEQTLLTRYPESRIVAFGHLGDGNLHYNVFADLNNEAATIQQINRVVHDLVAELNGSISAEHGLGQLKREDIKRYKSMTELAVMRSIKQALDPLGIMNPGKVL